MIWPLIVTMVAASLLAIFAWPKGPPPRMGW